MTNKREPSERGAEDVMDEDTVELVAIDPALLEAAGQDAAAGGADGPQSQSQAFLWLKHMESELDRLQSRWGQIDTELAERDGRIEGLLGEIESQETVLVEVRAHLDARTAEVAARESDLERLRTELAEREKALEAKDSEIGAGAKALGEAGEHSRDLEQRLQAARARISELELGAQRARTEHDELSQRFAQLGRTNEGLLGKVQDLELYIEGRKNDWTQRSAELARYRSDLAQMERTFKDKDKEGARREKDKEKLNDKILELERRCSELIGRRRERDDAYQELEERLAQQIKATEQLRADLKQGEAAAQSAGTEAANAARALEALRRELEQRDAKLAELAERNESLAAAAAESEQREAAAVTASEQREQELAGVRAELADVRGEREQLTHELTDARRALAALESASEATADRARGLETELEAARAHVHRLERELEERRQTMNLLDKNLHRINVLGASLHRIDREEADVPETQAPGQLAQTHSDGNVHYLGSAEARAATKLLVGTGTDGSLTFPLNKQNMTIGRSHKSDIRINGQFVSRIHARVLAHPVGTVIEDLGSKNGIFVNAQPVTRCVLKDGDIVSLGGKLDLKYIERSA